MRGVLDRKDVHALRVDRRRGDFAAGLRRGQIPVTAIPVRTGHVHIRPCQLLLHLDIHHVRPRSQRYVGEHVHVAAAAQVRLAKAVHGVVGPRPFLRQESGREQKYGQHHHITTSHEASKRGV